MRHPSSLLFLEMAKVYIAEQNYLYARGVLCNVLDWPDDDPCVIEARQLLQTLATMRGSMDVADTASVGEPADAGSVRHDVCSITTTNGCRSPKRDHRPRSSGAAAHAVCAATARTASPLFHLGGTP